MFCKKCGEQITDDSVFCYKCGQKVSDTMQNAEVLPEDKPTNLEDQPTSSNEVQGGIQAIQFIVAIVMIVISIAAFFSTCG